VLTHRKKYGKILSKREDKEMEITEKEYEKIAGHLPVQRGNVEIPNILFLNALLYAIENGCKWRKMPEKYGKWNSIYQRARRWSRSGVLGRAFIALQKEQIIKIRIERISLDSTCIKVHPDAHGEEKKTANSQSEKLSEDGILNFMWVPLMTE
jgi:transposase